MNCEDCFFMLDDYLEAELDAACAFQIKEHLSICAGCQKHFAGLKKERELYLAYSSEMKTFPAVWNDIKKGIEEVDRNRSGAYVSLHRRFGGRLNFLLFNPSFIAWAALSLLIIAGAITGLIKYTSSEKVLETKNVSQNQEPNFIPPIKNIVRENEKPIINDDGDKVRRQLIRTAAADQNTKLVKNPFLKRKSPDIYISRPAAAERCLTSNEAVRKAEQEYIKAIDMLNSDIRNRREQILPEKNSMLEQSLAKIDLAIKETQQAVSKQPGDPVAIQYMTAAYAKKIELLRTIAGR